MKTVRLFAVSAVFAAIFAVSAFAQVTTGKIGLINTYDFEDEKEGITKYVNANKSLEAEFKPAIDELQKMAATMSALQKELQGYEEMAKKGVKLPIAEAEVSKKIEQLERMSREAKFKEEDLKGRYERRRQVVLGPIQQDIGAAIDEFTKKNGFAIMLDIAKLGEQAVILSLDPAADVTKQFIQFYNARPATAATTTVPK
jgi:Skp family chaperone for outer membrane proteins